MVLWPLSGTRRESGQRRKAEWLAKKKTNKKKTGANSRSPKRLSRQLKQTSMEGRVAVGSVCSYILPILGVGGLFLFLLLSYRSSLHRLDTSLLSDIYMCIVDIFSEPVAFLSFS